MLRPGRGASACAGTTSEETRNGNRSQSRNHARLHRVQAAELSDAEVEAELARPDRVQEVLPLVRSAHAAPGDSVMARQTRAQRRARREQMAPGGEAALSGGPPAPPRRPTARAGAQPEP